MALENVVADQTTQPSEPRGSVPDPMIGTTISGRFRIVALLARGGMGKVYRAEQTPLAREVALKVLEVRGDGETQADFHKLFVREASALSKLTHPNTVAVFDYGKSDEDVYYIAMELLEGRTLHRYLADEGPLSAAKATHIARQIGRSLREAHSLGIVHRDLKPANVFLVTHAEDHDFVKVLDFGLVKDLTDQGDDPAQAGLFMGSPRYMSPEQIEGDHVDARADVYALGVVMYEMLTGHVPFERGKSASQLAGPTQEEVPPMAAHQVKVPRGLERLVHRALATAPAARFASMDEMIEALDQAAREDGRWAVDRMNATGNVQLSLGSASGAQSKSDPGFGSAPDPSVESLGGLASSSDPRVRVGSVKGYVWVLLLVLSVAAVAFALWRSRARQSVNPVAPASVGLSEPDELPQTLR